jgi:hypothetical protein
MTPSLLVIPYRYKASKLYSQLPESGAGDFTVVRNTTATRVNASGLLESVAANVPRIDYTGGGCGSLLVEPAATNLFLRSEEFEAVSWAGSASGTTVTPNAINSPANTLTADLVTRTTGGNIQQTIALTSGTTYTASYFLKKGTVSNELQIVFTGTGFAVSVTVFNFDTLTLTDTTGTTANKSVVNYGNGWYRVSLTKTATSTNNGIFRLAQNNNLDNYYIWGAQLETGSVATSYIPTVATTQTRNADAISLTGASALIGQASGTIYAEVNLTEWTNAKRVLAISDGTQDNRITLLINTTNRIRALVTQVGSTQADINTSTGLTNGTYKIAFAYASNDFVLYVNGTQIGTDTSGLVPACSSVYIGKLETSSTTLQLNDRITTAALYPTRLTNAELAALTTL